MNIRYAALVLGALGLVACGDDDATTTNDDSSVDDNVDDDTKQDDTSEDDSTPAATGDENTATVTIDGTTYEFDVTPGAIQRCDTAFFGGGWALAAGPDNDGNGMELQLPGEDQSGEVATLQVRDEANDLEFEANPEGSLTSYGYPDGRSKVDDWTIDGNTMTGTATVVEQNAVFAWVGAGKVEGEEPPALDATFEVTCASS